MTDHLAQLQALASHLGLKPWVGEIPGDFRPFYDAYGQLLIGIQIKNATFDLGLLAYILTDQEKLQPEYATYLGQFKKFAKPADIPANSSAATIDAYKISNSLYNDQQAWIHALNFYTPTLLPDGVVNPWRIGKHKIITKQFWEMIKEVRVKYYLAMTDEERLQRYALLQTPPEPNSTYPALHAFQAAILLELASNDTPPPVIDQVTYLRLGAIQLGDWSAPPIVAFLKLPAPDRTFTSLHELLLPAWHTRNLTKLNHFAAAGAQAHAAKASTDKEQLADALAEIKRLKSQLQRRTPATENNSSPDGHHLYCWTHGGCDHRGNDCLNKHPDHNNRARFYKLLGGSTLNVKLAEGPGKKA